MKLKHLSNLEYTAADKFLDEGIVGDIQSGIRQEIAQQFDQTFRCRIFRVRGLQIVLLQVNKMS